MPRPRLLAIFVLLFFVGPALVLITIQRNLIFFPEILPQDYEFSLPNNASEVFFTTRDNKRINALHFRAEQSKGVVLYFHGNAQCLAAWQVVAEDFLPLSFDVFVIDYRGYGKSQGAITDQGLHEDAHAAYAYLRQQGYDADRIVVYGNSLGGAMAARLAAEQEVGALILQSTFTSLLDIAKRLYPYLLPSLTLRFHLDTLGPLSAIRAPILIIHGTRDELIPVEHSERLLQAAGPKAQRVLVEGGGHNDLPAFPAYHRAIADFLRGVGGVQGG